MRNIFIRRTLIFILAASSPAFAQSQTQTQAQPTGDVFYQTATAVSMGPLERGPATVVQGAPYSATITNESVQTLADGNRIVQTSSGTIARDSQGRTRQDAPLPPIGNMSAADVPRIVFIQDPVAQISYTLDLTNKTAQKMPTFSAVVGHPRRRGRSSGTAMLTMEMGAMRLRFRRSASARGVHPEESRGQRSVPGHNGESRLSNDGGCVCEWNPHHAHDPGGSNRQRQTDRHCDRDMDIARSQHDRLQQTK